jgi:uncharacterized membrane protein SirB2
LRQSTRRKLLPPLASVLLFVSTIVIFFKFFIRIAFCALAKKLFRRMPFWAFSVRNLHLVFLGASERQAKFEKAKFFLDYKGFCRID